MTPRTLSEVVDRASVVVCCGSGGVGKTTTAALIAMHAAQQGRRSVLGTIDAVGMTDCGSVVAFSGSAITWPSRTTSAGRPPGW